MKKLVSSLLLFLFAVMAFAPSALARDLKIVDALGDYPRPDAPATIDDVRVEFLRASEGLKYGQPVIAEVSFGNLPAETAAAVQWVQDGASLADGYYSAFDIGQGATMTYNSVLPYYGAVGTTTQIGLFISVGGSPLSYYSINIPFIEGSYADDEMLAALQKVKPVIIEGTVLRTTDFFNDRTLKSKKGTVPAGTNVFYIDHYMVEDNDFASYIQFADGSRAWVKPDSLNVSTKNYTSEDILTDREKELFVKAMCYSSETPYLIWINLAHQKVNIFMGEQYRWVLQKSFLCATGLNRTPTPAGTYKYCGRDNAWIKEDYQVRPILYFDLRRGLAFHSRLYSPDGSHIIDATIGRPASHGCIRMYDDALAWMKLYLTYGTTVIVY